MPNNVAASMTASIVIDKSDLLAQILKGLSEGQKELENNKLELYFDFSDSKNKAEFEKVIQRYKKELSSNDFVIKIKNQGIEETIKSLDKLLDVIKSIASGKGFGIGSGNGIGNSTVDEKQLKTVVDLFTKMESHLSSIKKVFSDVGDGGEFSPLLKTLESIENSINNVREATSKIKLNVGIDLGNNTSEKMNQKISQSTSRQLEAYRNLFSAMKGTGKTTKEMLKFFEPDDASVTELIGMYQGIIKRAEKSFKVGNSNVYEQILGSTYKNLKNEIKNANAQLSRNENKSSSNGILGDLFSSQDLSGVIEQLNVIVSKLDEISSSTKGFTETFKNGLNVNASVEEIEKLTNRVKELEGELNKIKTPTTSSPSVNESNISSDNLKIKDTASSTSQIKDNLDDVKILTDNFGKALDPVVSKFLELNTLTDKNGNIYRLFHNSSKVFDKFDTSKSGINQGSAFGTGNYLSLSQSGEYNNEAYGKYQTQWYAIVKKAFDINAGDVISQSEADFIAKKFFGNIEDGFGAYLSNELASKSASEQIGVLKEAAEKANTSIGKIFNSIGYDAIKDGAQINVFNSDNIIRASDAILDISQQPFKNITELDTKLYNCNQEIKELEKQISSIEKFDFSGVSQEDAQKKISALDEKVKFNDFFGIGFATGKDKENLSKMAVAYKETYGEAIKLKSISETEIQNYAEKQKNSSAELANIKETLKARQEEAEILKQQIVSQRQVASEITNSYLNNDSNKNTKDALPSVDTKLDEATSSAKDLDKTLDKIDVPTESFDEVLEKLDRTKSELIDVVKITRKSVSDVDGKFRDSYTLKDSRGSTEIYGINSKTDKGQILDQNIVKYDAKKDSVDESKELLAVEKQITSEINAQTKAQQKKWQAFSKEQSDYEKSVNETNSAIQKTDELLDKLPLHDKLDAQFIDVLDSVDKLNSKLKLGEISLSEYKNEVKIITSEYSKMVNIQNKADESASKQQAKDIQTEWDKNIKAIQDYMDAVTELNNLKAKDKGTGKNASEIKKQTEHVEELKETAYKARQNLSSMFNPHDVDISTWNKWLDAMKQFDQATTGSSKSVARLEDALRNANESQSKYVNSIKNKHNEYLKDYKDDSIKDGYISTNNYKEKIAKYEVEVSKLNTLAEQLSKQDFVTKEQSEQFENLKHNCENARKELTKMSASDKGAWAVDIQKEIDKINSDLMENTNYSKKAKTELKAFIEQLKAGNISDTTLKEIHNRFLEITNAEKLAGRAGRSFFDTLKNSGFHQFAAQMAGMFSFYDIINVARQGINTIRELNGAMTEVRKVSEATESQYSSFQQTVASTAKEIASTNKELLNSSADFLRLGYDLNQAEDLAKNATLFVNVGDGVDITEATEDMITAMKAFDIQAEDSIKIVDDYNQIGKYIA